MSIKKIFSFYLKNSYHRPSAKLYSIKTCLTKIIYSKKTNIFSERSALLKKPLLALEFYNAFGRYILYIKYFLYIVFLNDYPKKSYIRILNQKNNIRHSLLNPIKPFHYYDSKENNIDGSKLLDNYYKHLETYKNINGDSEWWIRCRREFQKLFILPNKKLNLDNLKNFRSLSTPSADLLNDTSRLLNREWPHKIQKLMSLRLIMLYHELAERINTNILLINSDSEVGNPPILNYRDVYLTQRSLRFAYYLNTLENNLSKLFEKKNNLILDIGGGFGGFLRSMYNYFPKNTYMICDLPETLLLAEYFLKSCFSDKKFLHVHDLNFFNSKEKSFFLEYDFIFFTPDIFYNLEKKIIDLTMNITSLCEMTKTAQQMYISSIERNSKYFYSVNRYSSRKDKFDTIGFEDLIFKKRIKPLKVGYTHTYHYEFLGKII